MTKELEDTEVAPDTKMSCAVDGADIVIRIPIDLLKWAQEDRPDELIKVNDVAAMSQYVASHILDQNYDQDDGSTGIERLLDDCFTSAYEDDQKWLDWKDFEDEDDEE